MTTVQARCIEIYEVEGFNIEVLQDGNPVNPRTNGVMGGYPYRKKLKHTKTINQWKVARFNPTYPGLDCNIPDDSGNVIAPQTLLGTVRESYEEDTD